MQPKKMSHGDIEAIVKRAIDRAKFFVTNNVEKERVNAMKYYKGETALDVDEDRSKVVDTVVRDTVRAVKPVLMRVFLQAEKPAEYIPKTRADVAGAEQATEYAQWVFDTNGGFNILRDAFHDALVLKTGIVKAYWDKSSDVDIEEYSNLTDEEITLFLQDAQMQGHQIDVLEHDQREVQGPQGMMRLHNVKLSITKTSGKIGLDLIPPERFFVDETATDAENFYVIGDSQEVRVSDLIEMGFDREDVKDLGAEAPEEEESERQWETAGQDDEASDPSMKEVTLTECYMRMDIEGTGIARLYKFYCGGDKHKLLDFELADDVPYSVFQVDPEPHTFFGKSLAELVMEDQNVATSLLRGLIDSVHLSNNPKTYFARDRVDVDALLNNEYGALVACENPQTDVMEAVPPNSAATTLPAMQYHNERISEKTGVSEAALGTNGDMLKGETVAGVQAAIQGAQAQIECMARNLAEGGYKRLFKLLLRLIRKHVPPGEFMRMTGQFVPVDPSSWSADMDVSTNVGLGTGAKAERAAALQNLIATQTAILQGYGMQNGLVTLTHFRNAQEDLAAIGGLHNFDRYMSPMDPQTEAALLQQQQAAAQQQPQQPDPNQAIAMAENIRAQAKLQSDQMQAQVNMQRYAMEDDRKRDEMEQQAILQAMDLLGKYNIQPQPQLTAPIRAMQAQPR